MVRRGTKLRNSIFRIFLASNLFVHAAECGRLEFERERELTLCRVLTHRARLSACHILESMASNRRLIARAAANCSPTNLLTTPGARLNGRAAKRRNYQFSVEEQSFWQKMFGCPNAYRNDSCDLSSSGTAQRRPFHNFLLT